MSVDAGRLAVYEAEEAAFGGTALDEIRPIADLAATAAGLTAGEWWWACGGPSVVVVAARTGAASSSARLGSGRPVEIRLAAGQATTATLGHELGHALAGVAHGHDGRFRAAHVDVAAVLVGREAANDLATAYRAFGVPPGARSWASPRWVTGDGFAVVR